jgi:hypothetical protein
MSLGEASIDHVIKPTNSVPSAPRVHLCACAILENSSSTQRKDTLWIVWWKLMYVNGFFFSGKNQCHIFNNPNCFISTAARTPYRPHAYTVPHRCDSSKRPHAYTVPHRYGSSKSIEGSPEVTKRINIRLRPMTSENVQPPSTYDKDWEAPDRRLKNSSWSTRRLLSYYSLSRVVVMWIAQRNTIWLVSCTDLSYSIRICINSLRASNTVPWADLKIEIVPANHSWQCRM